MNKNLKLAGAGVLSLVALGGGVAIGSTIADPTSSDVCANLQSDHRSAQVKVKDLETDLSAVQKENEELSADLRAAEVREDDLAVAEAALKNRESKAATAEAAVKQREDAVKGAETAKAASSITDGSWTIGRTVEPETYTTGRVITGSCYWEITTSGTNGDDIVANDNVSGGQPTVTLAQGQDFKSQRCGTWIKLG